MFLKRDDYSKPNSLLKCRKNVRKESKDVGDPSLVFD